MSLQLVKQNFSKVPKSYDFESEIGTSAKKSNGEDRMTLKRSVRVRGMLVAEDYSGPNNLRFDNGSENRLCEGHQEAYEESSGGSQLRDVLKRILSGELSATAPLLTDVTCRDNLIVVHIHNVSILQSFATDTNSFELSQLICQPIHINLEDRTKLELNLKIFLNGSGSSRNKSMSVFSSIRTCRASTEEFAVSWFLRGAANDVENYRKTYRMPATTSHDNNLCWKGCLDFISVNKMTHFITGDDSMQVGVMVSRLMS